MRARWSRSWTAAVALGVSLDAARGENDDALAPGEDVAWVATGVPQSSGVFMSMSCLRGCAKNPRFISIAADRTVA